MNTYLYFYIYQSIYLDIYVYTLLAAKNYIDSISIQTLKDKKISMEHSL